MAKQPDEKSSFLVCDVLFNDQSIIDVNLATTCSLGKIVQGLLEDDKFRNAALSFLKTKEEQQEDKKDTRSVQEWSLKSFHSLDRSILRAYVAIQLLPTWRWLEFKDFVTDFENKKESLTIADVLGSVSHKPVFQVVPKSGSEADDTEVKSIVQELLTTKSLATLSAAGCPLSKGMMSLIGQNKYTCTITFDKREKFIHWLRRQDLTNDILNTPERSVQSPTQPMTPIKIAKSRVTFDPEAELATLVKWFNINQRPSKEMIEEYTEALNKGRTGKAKRMLTQESIAVWFKNRRAKTKKEGSFTEPWEKIEEHVTVPTMETDAKHEENESERKGVAADGSNSLITIATINAMGNRNNTARNGVKDQGNNSSPIPIETVESSSVGNGLEDHGRDLVCEKLVLIKTTDRDRNSGKVSLTDGTQTDTKPTTACLREELSNNLNQATDMKAGDMKADEQEMQPEDGEQRRGDQMTGDKKFDTEHKENQSLRGDEKSDCKSSKHMIKRNRKEMVDHLGDHENMISGSEADSGPLSNAKRQCIEMEDREEPEDKGEWKDRGKLEDRREVEDKEEVEDRGELEDRELEDREELEDKGELEDKVRTICTQDKHQA